MSTTSNQDEIQSYPSNESTNRNVEEKDIFNKLSEIKGTINKEHFLIDNVEVINY